MGLSVTHSIATAKEINHCFFAILDALQGPVAQLVEQRIEKVRPALELQN